MHQPRLPRQTPLQGLRAPQAPSMTGRRAKGKKMRRSSGQERGRSGQGSGRLMVEVIQPGIYRLEDDNDNMLTKRLEQLCHFPSPKIQSYHYLLSVCSD